MENEFCKNLKELREGLPVSQKQLALAINTTLKTISHWETGYTEPSLQQLIAIAEFFDVSLDELVGRKMK